jgi:hypothetical protein
MKVSHDATKIPRGVGHAVAQFLTSGTFPVAAVFALLGVRLFWFTNRYAVNIFNLDQWDFNDAVLFQDHTLWEIFRWQHGPHREGFGTLLAAIVEPWFHWNGRAEAFIATGLIAMAALCALYLKYRLWGALAWTDAVIPLIMLKPDRRDALWETVNFSHSGVPLLILLYCLSWTCRQERVKYALVVAFNFLITYTGYGFFIGLLTPVLLVAHYRSGAGRCIYEQAPAARKWLAWSIAASFASLGSFFLSYLHQTAAQCDSLWSAPPVQYFWFVDVLYATAFGTRGAGMAAKAVGLAVFLLVAAVAAAGWRYGFRDSGRTSELRLVSLILTAYSLLFCISGALGRTCMGIATALESRHINYVQLGILGLYLGSLAVGRPALRKLLPAALLIALLPSLRVAPSDAAGMEYNRGAKAGWRSCYLSGHKIADCDRVYPPIYPWPERTHLREKLDYLQATEQNLFSDSHAFQ